MAKRITRGNIRYNKSHDKNKTSWMEYINLKGIGIGNALMHPVINSFELAAFAYNLGLIDFQEREYVEFLNL